MSILSPLSNDPEVMTQYAQTLGLIPDSFQCSEVFSLDPEMLAFLPPNPKSLIFLYPIGPSNGTLENRHQNDPINSNPQPWFSYQTLSNACGTIAIIHTILNNLNIFLIKENSWLDNFIKISQNMSPEERGKFIEKDDSVKSTHEATAISDDTPFVEQDLENHFIAFIEFNNQLYELDGRKPQPICHGPITNLIENATNIIQNDFYPFIDDVMRTSLMVISTN